MEAKRAVSAPSHRPPLFSPSRTHLWHRLKSQSVETEAGGTRRGRFVYPGCGTLGNDVGHHEVSVDRTHVADVMKLAALRPCIAGVVDGLFAVTVIPFDRAGVKKPAACCPWQSERQYPRPAM